MVTARVKNGTRTDCQDRLCTKCKYASIKRGPAESQEIVTCQQDGSRVNMRVVECNRFMELNQLSLYEMEEIAWLIEKKKGTFGFTPPSETPLRNVLRKGLGQFSS